jgi:phospholipase/carboxylesterase
MQDFSFPAVEIEPNGPHLSSLLWLHGLGADGYDFEPVAREMNLPASLGVRYVLPHAPHRPVTINGGYVMRAWYDIAGRSLEHRPDSEGIRASREILDKLVDRELALGIPPERILLAGFSQGGVIALEAAAHRQNAIGGVIALSSYLAHPEQLPAASRPLPVFLAHGTQDPVVPYPLGEASRDRLTDLGYRVEWHSYPMQHSVCWEEIGHVRDWLLRRLQG